MSDCKKCKICNILCLQASNLPFFLLPVKKKAIIITLGGQLIGELILTAARTVGAAAVCKGKRAF